MSRKLDDGALEVLGTLVAEGWSEVEVFAKRGRSRTWLQSGRRQLTSVREEAGWSVRAGDDRRSFFYAQSGAPRADIVWPDADGLGLRLPNAQPIPSWSAPADLDAPLIGENEARALVRGIGRALDTESPGARLQRVELEDGSSESSVTSSREVRASTRHRVASMRLEAVGPGADATPVVVVAVAREARRFHPVALAHRLADRLAVAEKGRTPARDRGEMLLAPPVMTRLLGALGPLWLGPDVKDNTAGLDVRGSRLGSTALTLVDNGRLPGGLLEAPADGEGMPTREVRLIEEGLFGSPLLAWWQTRRQPRKAAGCAVRASWRDLPAPGPTHLYLQPEPAVTVADLLGEITRGYYLLDLEGDPRIDLATDRFAAPVCGFAVDGGRATGSVTRTWLVGTISGLLTGLVAKARDLTFLPLHGMIGAPTALVRGLELRHKP